MNNRGPIVYPLLFGLLMVFLFSFMIQEQFKPFKMKPLNGRFAAIAMPKLTMETYKNGYYQKATERYISRNFGFREPIIRLYNQYCWDFYRKTYVSYTFAGKKNWLYFGHNIENYYGTEMYHWFDDAESARKSYEKEVRLMNKVRGVLQDYDVTLLTFIAPSKADIYPEYLPRRDFDTSSLNAREYFAARAAATGLPCFDMTDYYLKMKDTCSFSVFPATGDHWNFSGVYATDTLLRFMGQQKGWQLPHIEYGNEYLTSCRIGEDKYRDLETEMNLIRPIRLRPEFQYKERDYRIVRDSLTTKPTALFIGNSFLLWAMEYIAPRELFSDFNFWYYNKRAYQGLEQIIDSVSHLNRLDILLDADYIVWFSSASQMYRATEGFAEDAIIQLCIGEERFQQRLKELNDSLYDRKGNLEEIKKMMRKDPEAYFPEIASDGIPEARNPILLQDGYWTRRDIRRQIKHDPQWMANITTKLSLLDLGLQDAVDLEADNMLNGRPLMRDTKTSRHDYKELLIMKTIQQIKNDPTWYQLVVKDAEKKDISIEQNLRNHAEYTVNTRIGKGKITLPED